MTAIPKTPNTPNGNAVSHLIGDPYDGLFQGDLVMKTPSAEPVTIANSELRRLRSSIVGQDYLVKVRLPESYDEEKRTYPVLYLLDGDHAFALATDVVQYLIYCEQVPDLIIISPAYGSKAAPHEGAGNMRDRDLVPFYMPGTALPHGGAQYLQFVQRELLPFAESNYRIDSTRRTLWGYSYGGIFALYALLQNPKLFGQYIVLDGFDEQLLGMEEQYAAQHMSLPAKLFVAAPPGEGYSAQSAFVDKIKSRGYGDLEVEFAQLSDLGHCGIAAEGLTKGLIALFRS
jgi:hypothetical protein